MAPPSCFFQKVPAPAPLTLYVRVDDADALHARYASRQADITEALGSRPWGMREFALRDPDGHLLRFGHGERAVDQIPDFRAGD